MKRWHVMARVVAALVFFALFYAMAVLEGLQQGVRVLFALAAAVVAGYILLQVYLLRASNRIILPPPARDGFLGGMFYPLVYLHLPTLTGLPRRKRREKFSALYAAALGKSAISQWDAFCFVMIPIVQLLLNPRIMGEIAPVWMVESWYLIVGALCLFRFTIWDACVAFTLYRLLRQEEINWRIQALPSRHAVQ